MVHLDIKKLRNFKKKGIRNADLGNIYKSRNKAAGSQYMHVAVDDHSRYTTVCVLEDEPDESVTKHLTDTYHHYAARGIVMIRVLTDNGSRNKSKRFAEACKTLNVKPVFTKPYTPRTNGKAERFIQTLLREWAYATEHIALRSKEICILNLFFIRITGIDRTEALTVFLQFADWRKTVIT